jgi:DNA-binding PadR family transcriptional regulator
MNERDLYSGFLRLHILHHADQRPIFGLGLIEELAQRGYRVSAGTLYPMLHALEAKGYLRGTQRRTGSRERKLYRTTPLGRRALAETTAMARELLGEVFGRMSRKRIPHVRAR